MRPHLITALIALVFGFAGAALWSYSGLGDDRTRAYLVANPDVLPEMAGELQRREGAAKTGRCQFGCDHPLPRRGVGQSRWQPDSGRVHRLRLRVLPQQHRRCESDDRRRSRSESRRARMADFRRQRRGRPHGAGGRQTGQICRVSRRDVRTGPAERGQRRRCGASRRSGYRDAAIAFAASAEADREIAANMRIAQTLGFSGTPSWIAGGGILEGAVGRETLTAARQRQTALIAPIRRVPVPRQLSHTSN